MIEGEEADAALQMPSAEFESVEQSTVDLASAGITATGPREDVEPSDRRVSAELDNPILATVLLKLLDSAHQALAGERGQAHQFIARATALVSAEVRHREAGGRWSYHATATSRLGAGRR